MKFRLLLSALLIITACSAVSADFDLANWANQALRDHISPETLANLQEKANSAADVLSKFKDDALAKGNEAASAFLTHPATQAAYEKVFELRDDLLAKGNEATSAILANPTTQSIISQTTSGFKSLEQQAHGSFCALLNDPRSRGAATHLQELNKQTSEALKNVLAHPNAVEVRERYDALVKQSSSAYSAFLETNPEAKKFASTAEQVHQRGMTLCKDHPVLCAMLASGLAEAVFPGGSIVPSLLGFGTSGPRANSLAAALQRSIYGSRVPRGSLFSTMQRWGMVGLSTGTKTTLVGGPGAALLAMGLWEDWTVEGCAKYKGDGREESKDHEREL